MKRIPAVPLAILALSLILVSWGSTGHQKINGEAALSFNQAMSQFQAWAPGLIAHASDADIRKATDPTEGPKHYIDIDNYNDFVLTGRIIQDYDSAVTAYGSTTLIDNGILPWATLVCYDSLRACFLRLDWDKALLFAADLGHYVADGHMPLHITRNYNGQYTGNTGIHSRYESTMINAYAGQISYSGDSIHVIQDVGQYIFDYLYANYVYVDSVLIADTYATNVGSGTSSSVYKQALWDKTGAFTIQLFKGASHTLAELIYNALVEAGSPSMTAFIHEGISNGSFGLNVSPNPAQTHTGVEFSLVKGGQVQLAVYDTQGRMRESIFNGNLQTGIHSLQWDCDHVEPGLYLLVLQAGERRGVNRIAVLP